MSVKALKKISVEDVELQKVQENLSQWATPIQASQILDGVLLKNVVLTTGQSTIVDHKLGRPYIGWLVVRPRANFVAWESSTQTLPNKQISIETSATTIADLWVF